MYILILIGLLCLEAETYVLLQVRKQDNNYSNVDALIHKVVPSENVVNFANKFGKKRLSDHKKYDKPNESMGREIGFEINRAEDKNAADIEKSILKFAKKDKPAFRSKQDSYVKPKIINFRNSKPSVVFEIDSKTIVKTLKDMLSSKTFQRYMEKFTRKAAIVFRAIKEEIDKDYH